MIGRYKTQSSAKRRTADEMLSVMSLMYNKKKKGPGTVHLGSPDVTCDESDVASWTMTVCVSGLLENNLSTGLYSIELEFGR